MKFKQLSVDVLVGLLVAIVLGLVGWFNYTFIQSTVATSSISHMRWEFATNGVLMGSVFYTASVFTNMVILAVDLVLLYAVGRALRKDTPIQLQRVQAFLEQAPGQRNQGHSKNT